MISNVLGRVKNTPLPKSQSLLPLFEAIINSIDAIEDIKSDISDGSIEITILRPLSLPYTNNGDSDSSSSNLVDGFTIVDNGIGFIDANFDAFNEADTRYREQRGGKGVGRFIWLKAFKLVEVDSIFQKGANQLRRRFTFSLNSPDGISDHEVTPVTNDEIKQTTVRLLQVSPDYQATLPRNPQLIAHRIVEHCLEYFVWNRMPKISLRDGEDEKIDLDEIYDRLVDSTQHEQLVIKGVNFDVAHFMLHYPADLKHNVNFCANKRLVTTKRISDRVPNLPLGLTSPDKNGSYVYTGYISSDYLDKRVNQQRTGFDTLPEDGFEIPGELTWADIEVAALSATRQFLSPFTERVKVEKEERISEYVANNAPQYRYIIKNHPDRLDSIAPDVSDDRLDAQLYDISRKIEADLKEKAELLFEDVDPSSDQSALEGQLQEFAQWWEEYNEVGKSTLAKYIVHRKRILTILEKVLGIQDGDKYSREEAIHRIIFPLRKTSDDITYDQHNLWVLDEKLAYHEYLASDIPLRKNSRLEADSASRPDLMLFFNRAIAIVDDEPPFNSGIVIFEFKRPMRTDYTDEDNPITQVLQYVQEIKEGNTRTKDGRPIQVPPRTPFYCYVVCDLTKE